MAPVVKIHNEYYGIKKRFINVLDKIRKYEAIDEPTAFVLKSKMTDIIESMIEKNCDKSKGRLLTLMLKVEADLAIAGHVIYLKRRAPIK